MKNISIKNKAWFAWARIAVKAIILAGILWLIFGIFFGLYRVEGVAMSDRVKDGDLTLISRMSSEYIADEVIIFEHDGNTRISAILAVAGDLIEMDDNGRLYVNGVQVSDDVMYDRDQGEAPSFSLPYRVPVDTYFVLNENLDAMEDSRSYGAIKKQEIKGKVIGILRTRAI